MQIEEVLARKEELQKEIAKLDSFIAIYRAICNHDWRYVGHDSHKDHEECRNCKDTRSI